MHLLHRWKYLTKAKRWRLCKGCDVVQVSTPTGWQEADALTKTQFEQYEKQQGLY